MNYELAKELEQEGFPQKHYWEPIFGERGELCDLPEEEHDEECTDWDCKRTVQPTTISPSLSQLIEACGGYFSSLNRGIDYWFANGVKGVHGFNERGSTHKEAVARLWLALQDN